MFKKLAFLLLSFFVFSACITTRVSNYTQTLPSPYTTIYKDVYIDTSFSDDDKTEIETALNKWNYALNRSIYFNIRNSDSTITINDIKYVNDIKGVLIIRVDSSCTFKPEDTTDKYGVHRILGWANSIGGNKIFLVRDRISQTDVSLIVMHELGHILGAEHINYKSLMYSQYTPDYYKCIDQATIKAVADYNKIDTKYLNYCTN